MTARGAAALVAVALAGPGCTSRAPEHDGIGNWRFAHTRLQDIQGPPDVGVAVGVLGLRIVFIDDDVCLELLDG